MGTARVVVVVLGLLCAALAQQRAEMLALDDLAQWFAADRVQPDGAVRPIARLASMASALLQCDGTAPQASMGMVGPVSKTNRLMVRGTADTVAADPRK